MEWIWYTNSEHFRKLQLTGRIWTAEALGAWVRKRVQKRDEHVLMAPFAKTSRGREEPDIYEILECARPYLPREGAFGEMVLNVGKAVYLAQQGRRRHHRHQPLHLHERHRVRGHLSAHQPRSAAESPSATSISTARSPTSTAIWASIWNWRGVIKRIVPSWHN